MEGVKMDNLLADDLLYGAKAISKEIGQSLRQTYYALETGILPAGKVGEKWVCSRKVLRARFAKITAGEAF